MLSPQGANALATAATVFEVLYDEDQAEEEVLMDYWAGVQAQRAREEQELAEAEVAFTTLSAEKDAAEEAVKAADREKSDAAWYLKQAEQTAQAMRCGSMPSKEDEAAEKAALSALKKSIDYHTQACNVAHAH